MKWCKAQLTTAQAGDAVTSLLRLGERTVFVEKKESGYTVATGNAARKNLNTQSIAQEE